MAGMAIMTDRMARFAELINRTDAMEEIAQRVAEGESLKAVCKLLDVPFSQVRRWISADVGRLDLYEQAQAFYADALADEALAIADHTEEGTRTKETADGTETITEDMLGHRKLKIETRLKLAAKWNRGRYGDSLQVQHTGETVVRLTFGVGGVPDQTLPALVGSSVAEVEKDYGV